MAFLPMMRTRLGCDEFGSNDGDVGDDGGKSIGDVGFDDDGSDGGSDGDGGDGINIKQLLFCQWLGDGPDAGWDVSTARQENNGTPTDSTHTINLM